LLHRRRYPPGLRLLRDGGRGPLVIRNGYFSYRWSDIFACTGLVSAEVTVPAFPIDDSPNPSYRPPLIEDVVAAIKSEKPACVFAPQVDTSSGILIPDDYIKAVADAAHEVGAIFVLDCVAAGCLWADMNTLGVDVLVTAPQKGWSGPAGAGLVMLAPRAEEALKAGDGGKSFAINLKKWYDIMKAYENGGHAYFCTMPTDALVAFRERQLEAQARGFENMKAEQKALGASVRSSLEKRGVKSVAAPGFQSPTVVVSYTEDMGMKTGAKFAAAGVQIAAGVPLMVDAFTKSGDFKTFRLGLFGLDKLEDVNKTMANLNMVLDTVIA